nr:hypothetical protein FVER53263_08583 [Fusarium verticillioides]
MKVVAVAGGTGSVGSTIVDGLVEYGKHKVYALSRKERPPQGAVNYLKVDYNDPDAITKALEAAGVNILICAISVVSPEANQAQKNLIRAAERSSTTDRFVISSFDMLHVKEDIELSPLTRYTFEAIDELEKTNLTYTRIANGWFLDYYGMPHWKCNLEPWINILNMKSKWAVIPADGSIQASFLTSQDMSRFVARLMDLEKWDTISAIRANTLSFNELVLAAEKARGTKFDVAVDSLEKLESGKISFFPDYPSIGHGEGDEAFFAMIHYQAGIGRYLVPRDLPPLDDKFPDLNVTTPLEVMETATLKVDVRNGLGSHISTLSGEQISNFLRMFYFSTVVYNVTLAVIKTVFLLQYYRAIPVRQYKKTYIASVVLVTCWSLSQIFLNTFMCWPIASFWDVTIKGTCILNKSSFYVSAAGNILTDILIMVLPIPVLRSLKLGRRQKWILMSVFCLGIFTCLISLVRIKFLNIGTDITWHNVESASWSVSELCCGIICACVPTLRPLLSGHDRGSSHNQSSYTRHENSRTNAAARQTGASRSHEMHDLPRTLHSSESKDQLRPLESTIVVIDRIGQVMLDRRVVRTPVGQPKQRGP